MFHDFLNVPDWSEVKIFVFVDDFKSSLLISGVFILKLFLETFHNSFLLLVANGYEMLRHKLPGIFYEINFFQDIIIFLDFYFTFIHLGMSKNMRVIDELIIFCRQIEILSNKKVLNLF